MFAWRYYLFSLIVSVLISQTSQPAQASQDSMVSLLKLYSSERALNSHERSYVSKRCSGLFTAILAITPETSVLVKPLIGKIRKFETLSIIADKKLLNIDRNVVSKKYMITLKAMASRYIVSMNDNYINTGQYLVGMRLESDIDFCNQISNKPWLKY